MGNSTLPTISDKLNVMASIHNRKLIAVLAKGLKEKDLETEDLKQRVFSLEKKVNDLCLMLKNNQRQLQQNPEVELHKEIVQEILEE